MDSFGHTEMSQWPALGTLLATTDNYNVPSIECSIPECTNPEYLAIESTPGERFYSCGVQIMGKYMEAVDECPLADCAIARPLNCQLIDTFEPPFGQSGTFEWSDFETDYTDLCGLSEDCHD